MLSSTKENGERKDEEEEVYSNQTDRNCAHLNISFIPELPCRFFVSRKSEHNNIVLSATFFSSVPHSLHYYYYTMHEHFHERK
jgi:hypothetical protein